MQPSITSRSPSALWRERPENAPLWIVDLPRQRILASRDGQIWEEQPVSTSSAGLGNRPESNCTPLGWHRVTAVIGKDQPAGMRFVSREATGELVTPWTGGAGDAILSRVLPLAGLEPGLNGHSLSRHIYIHGTHQEELLGRPASHGCIRMANLPLQEWADRLTTLPYVWIGAVL